MVAKPWEAALEATGITFAATGAAAWVTAGVETVFAETVEICISISRYL